MSALQVVLFTPPFFATLSSDASRVQLQIMLATLLRIAAIIPTAPVLTGPALNTGKQSNKLDTIHLQVHLLSPNPKIEMCQHPNSDFLTGT